MMRVRRSREKHTFIHTKNKNKKTNTCRHWRHHRLSWWQPTEPPAKTKIIKSTTSGSIACVFPHRRTRGYIHIYIHTHIYINLPVSSDNSSVFTSNTSGCVRNPDYVCRILNGSTGRLKVGVCQAPKPSPTVTMHLSYSMWSLPWQTDAHISSLVLTMSCRRLGAKPISGPMPGYCLLGKSKTNFRDARMTIMLVLLHTYLACFNGF